MIRHRSLVLMLPVCVLLLCHDAQAVQAIGSTSSIETEAAEQRHAALRELAVEYYDEGSPVDSQRYSRAFVEFTDLYRADPDGVISTLFDAFKASEAERLRADFDANVVRTPSHESPYTVKTVGPNADDPDFQGRGLVVAMHGGGNAPPEVNDSQWRIMGRYYGETADHDYYYVALRAPTDEWNGFYTGYIYPLIEKLIRQFVVCADVDPDRVYAIGYSHGGYGAFAIAPTMPDRFAAAHASASAPTPSETKAANLRNLHFTYMIGSRDTAYGRVERCQAFAEEIAQLRDQNPDAYHVEMKWVEGNGHGGLPDRDILPELLAHTRDPNPARVTWHQTTPEVNAFYWIRDQDPTPGSTIDVHAWVDGSGDLILDIDTSDDVTEIEIYPPRSVFYKPDGEGLRKYHVRWAGRTTGATAFTGQQLDALARSISERADPAFATPDRLLISRTPTAREAEPAADRP